MINMKKCNYVVGVLGIVIAGMIMQAAAAFPMEFTTNGPGPGFWPFALGGALFICAAILLGYTVINGTELASQEVKLTGPANKRVYQMMGIVVCFTILISLIGFYAAAIVTIPAVMYLVDYREKKGIALTTMGTVVFIYLVFGMLLKTQLPKPFFM
ncbi:MAG: tripartite tricarboxylate transporter TctB family protein [Phascolarctobacterium sp.]|nr:tripartite tricarboxylate transporter TctB family protein [Phascolarctobacterium sp.]